LPKRGAEFQPTNGRPLLRNRPFEFLRLYALPPWVIGANMHCKLFVALQLEVAHHFIERHARRRTRRSEPPATFGATKTPKPLLLNPHQLPAHGFQCRCAPKFSDRMPWYPLAVKGRSPFAAAYCLLAAENRQPVWRGGKCVKGTAKPTRANFE
jgi:hypothetical protein